MIRRDARLEDGAPAWTLISQVEHARLSAHLAQLLLGEPGRPDPGARSYPALRSEVLAAIAHHDDGWAQWERAPRLDPELGRPLSFMELDPPEAMAIWSRTIDSAATFGPLAAWMVAGHFSRLLDKADSLGDNPQAAAWQADISRRRERWLNEWLAVDARRHTRELADEALRWLWTFDEISLWLCGHGPAGDVLASNAVAPYTAGRGTAIEMHLSPGDAAADDDPPRGVINIAPWRFDRQPIEADATAAIVPAVAYRNPAELDAAGRATTLRWRLISPQ